MSNVTLIKSLPHVTAAIAAFEQRYRADHDQEHALLLDSLGRIVVERAGNEDSVKFTNLELEHACAGSLTHNHPKAKPFSVDDLILALTYGLSMRAVGITPEGEHLDYTLSVGLPSPQKAKDVERQFDIELVLAEKELADIQLTDRQWERESRHLAVTRLAQQFGFKYLRTQKLTSVSEMKQPHEVQRLDALALTETVMKRDVFTPLHAGIVAMLARNANEKGIIPVTRLDAVRTQGAQKLVYTMLGKPDQHGALTPYITHGNRVIPDSPYFAALWALMHKAATVAIERHADIMRKHLPADLVRLFELATISPFQDVAVHEMEDFEPLLYDPLHRWLGPDGKQLSDRIWNATGDMRRKLDAYLTHAISTGKPVQQMAEELQTFLIGGAGSYEAMRLARTETSAAANRADWAASQQNPFVESYSPFTSPRHECCDNCDDEEANGPYAKDDPAHLPPFHPECACGVRWVEVKQTDGIVERLRSRASVAIASARGALTDVIGPLSKKFINLLFRGGR